MVFRLEIGQHGRGFCHAVALAYIEVREKPEQLIEQSGRHGRCAVGEQPQALQTLGREARVIEHHCDHGGHHRGDVHFVFFHQLDHGAWIERPFQMNMEIG